MEKDIPNIWSSIFLLRWDLVTDEEITEEENAENQVVAEFQCDLCDHIAKNKSGLTKHRKKHKSSTDGNSDA